MRLPPFQTSLTIFLFVVFHLVFSVAFIQIACAESATSPETSTESASKTNEKANKLIVYYFHGHHRCGTCRQIESLTKKAVKDHYVDALESGRVELKIINYDEKENAHYKKDYELFTKAVIVSDLQNGEETRWKNLTKIWELVSNDEAFIKYIKEEMDLYLKERE